MPELHINGQLVTDIELGGQQVLKIEDSQGTVLYEAGPSKWITFTAGSAGSTVGMTHNGSNQTTRKPVMYISNDDGGSWTQWDYSTVTLANAGDKVCMYGKNPNGISSSYSNCSIFTMTGSVDCSGDITALLSGNGMTSLSGMNFCFGRLFEGCSALTSAPDLPAETLAQNCYSSMFNGCSALASAPTLAATTLASGCYRYMFQLCTSLTTAPSLPAETLYNDCYGNMFYGCSSLTAPPATLPAETLANGCYNSMFQNCTSLTASPNMRYAQTVSSVCCSSMLQGCSSLTTVYAPRVNVWNTNYFSNWLKDVAASGTLYKLSYCTIMTNNASGVPTGWTTQDYN